MPAIAAKLIGFASAHGQAYSALSALKKFGLLEEKDGRVVPTQRAMEVASLPDTDPRRLKTIRDAAISPAIYAELFELYRDTNIPSDETLAGELVAYKGFNPNGVKEFLKAFRETIEFSGLSDLTVLGSEMKATQGGENVKIGDYVQWEPNGILQFQEPKRVRNVSEGFVFVDGSPTGMPIAEVTIEKAPAESPKPHVVTPLRVVTRSSGGSATMKQDIFSVAEGEVVLSWPTPLSADSIEDLKAWLKIIERKISRSLPSSVPEPKNYMEEKLAAGKCVDIGTMGTRIRPGVFRLSEFKQDGTDYCDLTGKEWIRSIGKNKQSGEILASTSNEFYSNPEYECLFLR
jgi:hypothetical protein